MRTWFWFQRFIWLSWEAQKTAKLIAKSIKLNYRTDNLIHNFAYIDIEQNSMCLSHYSIRYIEYNTISFRLFHSFKTRLTYLPMKETFLWNQSENRQVKLHDEHDKMVTLWKPFEIEGLFPCARLKSFLSISRTQQLQPMIQWYQFRPFLMLLKLALKFLNDSKILHFFGIMSEIHQSALCRNHARSSNRTKLLYRQQAIR